MEESVSQLQESWAVNIRNLAGELVSESVDDRIRLKNLGETFAFLQLRAPITAFYDSLRSLQQLPIESSSIFMLQDVFADLKNVRKEFEAIASYHPNQGEGERDAIANNIYEALKSRSRSISELIAQASIANVEARLKTDFDPLVESAKSKVQKIQGHLEEAKQGEDAIKIAAGTSAFTAEANYYVSLKNRYAFTSIVIICVMALIGVFLLRWFTSPDLFFTGGETAGFLILKLASHFALPLVLVAVLLFLSKIFAAERHNSVVYEDKAAALRTFRAFADSANSQEVKDAVLLRATECIFTAQPTGYLKSPIEVVPTPAGIIGAVPQLGGKEDMK